MNRSARITRREMGNPMGGYFVNRGGSRVADCAKQGTYSPISWWRRLCGSKGIEPQRSLPPGESRRGWRFNQSTIIGHLVCGSHKSCRMLTSGTDKDVAMPGESFGETCFKGLFSEGRDTLSLSADLLPKQPVGFFPDITIKC
jgi:hypothetical protein